MKKCSYCGKEHPDEATVCDRDQTPLGAGPDGSEPSVQPPVICPGCGVVNDHKLAIEWRGSFNLLTFLAGGLIAVFFHNASHPRRVQCNQCGTLFNISTRASRVSRVILWLLITPTIICLIIVLVFFWHIAH